MKIYKTTYIAGTIEDPVERFCFHSSGANASKARTALKKLYKGCEPASEAIELTSNRDGILKFLNELVSAPPETLAEQE